MKTLIIAVSTLAFPLMAGATVDCSNSVLGAKSVYNLPGRGYWMQSAGACTITFTGWGGTQSRAFNTCENKPQPLTSRVDAWPVPGGTGDDLYVHPPANFYSFADAKSSNGMNQPIYSDPMMRSVYESIGLISDEGNGSRTVRIAMGWGAGRFRDYKIQKSGDKYSFTPVQPAPVDACKNLPSGGLDRETPMISRNGQMISAKDPSSQKTKIYKIDASGNCTEAATIPFQTSKTSFSFDNKNVAFVMKDPNTGKGRLMEFDITSGKTRTLSGPDENVMYMSYKPDGTILYTRAPKTPDPANANASDLVMLAPLSQIPATDLPKYKAIGLMWASVCQKEIDDDSATLIGERLTSGACNEVVSPMNFNSLEAADRGGTLAALKSACGRGPGASTPTSPASAVK